MQFREVQRFSQIWIWIIVLFAGGASVIPFLAGIYFQIILKKPFGNNPMSDGGLIFFAIFNFIMTTAGVLLFASLKLVTEVDEKGISYRFVPFHRKPRLIKWEEIKQYEVVRYDPVRDYGGWGLRYGKKGKAYNVAGNMGLQICLINVKNILLGTQKPDELKSAVAESAYLCKNSV